MPRVTFERLDGLWIGPRPDNPTGEKSLPTQTHAACFFDAHTFTTQPIPLVQNYFPHTGIYEVRNDVFVCSSSCAQGHFLSSNAPGAQQKIMWQRQMEIELFGRASDKVGAPAKPREALQLFGGTMTIDEWRNTTDVLMLCEESRCKIIPGNLGLLRFDATQPLGSDVASENKGTTEEPQPQEEFVGEMPLTTLTGVKRPPEHKVIRTREQLREAFSDSDAGARRPSVFANFMAHHAKPSEEESAEFRKKLQVESLTTRKRKHAVPEDVLNGPAPPPLVTHKTDASAAAAAAVASSAAKPKSILTKRTRRTAAGEDPPAKKKIIRVARFREEKEQKPHAPPSPEYGPNAATVALSPDYCPTSPSYRPGEKPLAPPPSPDYAPPRSPDYGPPRD